MDQLLRDMLKVNLLISPLHFSVHESPLLQLRRPTVEHEDRTDSVKEELADPAKKAVKDPVFIAILRRIHELDSPNTDIDCQRLAFEVLEAYAAARGS